MWRFIGALYERVSTGAVDKLIAVVADGPTPETRAAAAAVAAASLIELARAEEAVNLWKRHSRKATTARWITPGSVCGTRERRISDPTLCQEPPLTRGVSRQSDQEGPGERVEDIVPLGGAGATFVQVNPSVYAAGERGSR